MPPEPNHILADAIERWAKDAHSHSCGGDGLPNLDDYIGPQHNGWQDDNRFDWEAAASYNGTQGWEAGPLERAIEWGQKLNIDINSRIDDLRKRISEYSAFLSAYAPPVVATNRHECLDFSEQEKRIERLCGHAMRTAGWLRNAFIESIPKISIPAASIIAAKTLSIVKLHEHVIESLSIVAAWRKLSSDDAAKYAQEAVATTEKAFNELDEILESSDISGQSNRNTMNDLESAFQEISDGPFEWCGFTATSAHAAAWLVAYKLFYDDFMNYHASIDRFSDDNIALLQTKYAFNAKDLSRIETFIKMEEKRLLNRGFKIGIVGNPEQWNVGYTFAKPPTVSSVQSIQADSSTDHAPKPLVANDDNATESAAALSEVEWKVLQKIVDSPIRLTGPDAYTGLAERAGKQALKQLEAQGLIHRPAGPRKGYAATPAGIARASQMRTKSAP